MGGSDGDSGGTSIPTFWTGVDPLPVIAGFVAPLLVVCLMAGIWTSSAARYDRLHPPPPKLDAGAYARGQQLYAMACTACHGAEGQGVPGLGKNLARSPFARALNDAQLAAFVNAGRAADDPLNTTKIPMPPKGGRMDFGEQNIADVVTYLRGLGDPRRAPARPLPAVELVIGDPGAALPTMAAAAETEKPAASIPATTIPPTATAAAQTAVLDPHAVMRGKKAFISCMACHGKDGTGVKNMGRSLVNSSFVNRLDDKALVDFIKKGRGPTDPENTTRIAMPPRGGNPALKDAQISDIVAYIRSLNGAAVAAAAPRLTPPPPPAAPVASIARVPAAASAAPVPAPAAAPAPVKLAIAAPSGDAIVRGKKAYISCLACHGKDATGVKNMGKDLVNSPFVAGLTDQALVDFIKKGRGPTDPANTTKIGMPPKGGNPALKDEQIRDIVTYIRSLRQTSAGAQ